MGVVAEAEPPPGPDDYFFAPARTAAETRSRRFFRGFA